jgi:hypothetical protein
MLGLPETAFADPETSEKLDELQIADWIEGCVTFAEREVSQNDVVDVLHENYLTTKTDAQSAKNDAATRVKGAWRELERRSLCLGLSAPYRVNGLRVQRVHEWEETPAFSFCLLVALLPVYRKAFKKFKKKGYTKQGELFEQLTSAALASLGWRVHGVGWSKSQANSVKAKVEALAKFLGVHPLDGATQRWTAPKAKDAGLDLVCQYPFRDGWGGRPILMTQCASGDNWEDKLHTPELEHWKKLLDIHTDPKRGLSMPFAIKADRFRRAGFRAGFILLLDRHRLAVPDKSPADWVPDPLRKEISDWMKDRVKALLATAA